MADICIRPASLEDAAAVLAVYTPYVEQTAITFEWDPPSLAEFRGRMERILETHPFLAAEREGELLGYAYTGPFVGRAAYGWSAETTIYLRRDCRGQGLGRKLYGALEEVSRARGILNLYACIGDPETEDEHLTRASQRFHEKMGYRLVGRFDRCGYKFGRWYHMIWMEKLLGGHGARPRPVIPFRELEPKVLRSAGLTG